MKIVLSIMLCMFFVLGTLACGETNDDNGDNSDTDIQNDSSSDSITADDSSKNTGVTDDEIQESLSQL